jgi:MraZ protein
MTDKSARKFLRFSEHSRARFIIPQSRRDCAGLEKELVSLGLTNRIELWGKKKWDKYNSDSSGVDGAMFDLRI